MLSNKAKAIILGTCKMPSKHTANLHEISALDFIQANLHDLEMESTHEPDNPVSTLDECNEDIAPPASNDSTELLAFLSKQQAPTHAGHLANILCQHVQAFPRCQASE